MPVRTILTYPDPRLKAVAADVPNLDGRVAQLCEDMAETMYAAPGIGLAATQVGEPVRIIVLDVHEKDEGPGKNLLKLVNPVIAEREGMIILEEGCLSVPDYSAEVKRARAHPAAGLDAGREGDRDRGRRAPRRRAPARDRSSRRQALHRPPVPPEARPLPRAATEARPPGPPRVERTHAARHLSEPMSTRWRIVFMGTPAFACPILEALLAGPTRSVGVVCQPDRPRGRGLASRRRR